MLKFRSSNSSFRLVYRCVTYSTLQNIDGTGWIPVNFNQISFGRTLPKLPIDPINQTSTGQYYTYVTGGSWKLTSRFESQKYTLQNVAQDGGPDPALYEIGTNLNLAPFVGGLVGYWSFDEGSGTVAYDRSGNNNHGTLYNSPTWTQGKVGQALSFDGSDDYVDCGSSNILNSPNQMSILAWYFPMDLTSSRRARIGTRNGGGFLTVYGSSIGYESLNNLGSWENNFYIPKIVNLNSWQFFGFTFKSNDYVKIYKNGAMIGNKSVNGAQGDNFSKCLIGAEINGGWGTPPYFNGLIDEVRIYNRALSDAEIQAIYNANK